MKCIVITRPKEDAAATAKILAENGFAHFTQPVMELEILHQETLQNTDIIIITSKNALRALKQYGGYGLTKIIALGEATNEFAIQENFTNVEYAGDDISQLQQYIGAHYAGKNLVYASGERITKELSFTNCGAHIKRIVVYKTIPAQELSQDFKEKLIAGEFAAIMFFSSRTAEIFNELLSKNNLSTYKKQLSAICLSENIARKLQNYGFKATMFAHNSKKLSISNLLQNILI